MKKVLSLLLLCLPTLLISQEEIGRKVLLYGNVQGELKGKIAIRFNFMDQKIEKFAIEELQDKGANVIAWKNMFMPNVEYTKEEIVENLKEHNIEKMITLNLEGVDKSKVTNWYSTGGDYNYMYSSETTFLDNVKYSLDIYNLNQDFDKPVCVIQAEAKGGSDLSTLQTVSKKIIKRILDGIEEEGGFR